VVPTAPSDFLYGISPVLAALGSTRRPSLSTLYLQQSLAPKLKKDASDVARALALAERRGVRVVEVDKGELNNMAGNRPHQGLLLTGAPLPELRLDALPRLDSGSGSSTCSSSSGSSSDSSSSSAAGAPDAEASAHSSDATTTATTTTTPTTTTKSSSTASRAPVWLALDEVQDPQNLGALLRSAHFLGAAGVLVSSRNCAPLSAATCKASAGAMEVLPVHSTTNLVRTLARSRANGWRVVGAALGAPGTTVASHELELSGPTVLVLGNEGKGLRTLVRRECDVLAAIPSGLAAALSGSCSAGAEDVDEAEAEADGEEGGAVSTRGDGGGGGEREVVDSLNVSVAGAILLHQLLAATRWPGSGGD
jgi:21S rRNA (GM2251-2'-O)-methyltransferase